MHVWVRTSDVLSMVLCLGFGCRASVLEISEIPFMADFMVFDE